MKPDTVFMLTNNSLFTSNKKFKPDLIGQNIKNV